MLYSAKMSHFINALCLYYHMFWPTPCVEFLTKGWYSHYTYMHHDDFDLPGSWVIHLNPVDKPFIVANWPIIYHIQINHFNHFPYQNIWYPIDTSLHTLNKSLSVFFKFHPNVLHNWIEHLNQWNIRCTHWIRYSNLLFGFPNIIILVVYSYT